MKESQCLKYARSPTQPEGQGGRGGHQDTQDGGPDRADIRGPPNPGRGSEKQAMAGSPDIFGNGREQMRQQADADKDELYKQIGQLKVELDFLKKRAGLID